MTYNKSQIKKIYQEKGLIYIIRTSIKRVTDYITNPLFYYYFKSYKNSKTFKFQGKEYKYFYHKYSNTWKNERAIEIPIIIDYINQNRKKNLLEVGNVLKHYFPMNHNVVDKYEKSKDVINQDIVSFHPQNAYDLIVSISTIEHIGWDEEPKDYEKINLALKNLERLLSQNGKIIISLPLGYNGEMDRRLQENRIKFQKKYFFKRISKDNTWIEVKNLNSENIKYDTPYPSANVLMIGIIEKQKE